MDQDDNGRGPRCWAGLLLTDANGETLWRLNHNVCFYDPITDCGTEKEDEGPTAQTLCTYLTYMISLI